MKFSEEHDDQQFVITGYDQHSVNINGSTFHQGMIVSSDYFNPNWQPQTFSALKSHHLDELFELQPEIILLGTGTQQTFPEKNLYLSLINASIGFEIMNTQAACRTFNILTADNRNVVAALFCN
jgi:uncharacterized protein